MIKRVCILTKSYKHGGYCVAGIDLVAHQFVRLVSSHNPEEDEIKREQMYVDNKPIECFDVYDFNFIENVPTHCQTENWLVDFNYKPRYVKSLTVKELLDIIHLEKTDNFICNKLNLLDGKQINQLHQSLFIFHVKNLTIDAMADEYFGEIKFKFKCSFDYKEYNYTNISLTDPVYRDFALNGVSLKDALIVASLPCIPYKESYYKFVAKIIPIGEDLVSYIENLEKGVQSQDKDSNISPFEKVNITPQTRQIPGIVLFENYEQLRALVEKGVDYYSKFKYSLQNYNTAIEHRDELKYVKNILEKTKKEIVKSYNEPLEVIVKRIEELIDMVKVPFKEVDNFIKNNEKAAKKYEIYIFSKNVAISNGLQEHMENIFKSPAFFDEKWLNKSCSALTWKRAVTSKLICAASDINQILATKNENLASILAYYYQTLSLDKVNEFLNYINKAANITGQTLGEEKPQQKGNDIEVAHHLNSENEEVTPNGEEKTKNSEETFKDKEILLYVANAHNPFTKQAIFGVDYKLKTRLMEIAQKLSD